MFKNVYQLLLLHHIVYEKFEDAKAVAINRKCNIKLKKTTKKKTKKNKKKQTNKQTDYDLQNTENENKD